MCDRYPNCGRCMLYSLYLFIILFSSILIFVITFCTRFSFPDDSIFKNDQILLDTYYHDISFFPKIEEIYKNYSNDIYYKRKYDLSLSYNVAVIPIFMLLALIFGANLICCDNDKVWFIIIGILSIISQIIPFLNKKIIR